MLQEPEESHMGLHQLPCSVGDCAQSDDVAHQPACSSLPSPQCGECVCLLGEGKGKQTRWPVGHNWCFNFLFFFLMTLSDLVPGSSWPHRTHCKVFPHLPFWKTLMLVWYLFLPECLKEFTSDTIWPWCIWGKISITNSVNLINIFSVIFPISSCVCFGKLPCLGISSSCWIY